MRSPHRFDLALSSVFGMLALLASACSGEAVVEGDGGAGAGAGGGTTSSSTTSSSSSGTGGGGGIDCNPGGVQCNMPAPVCDQGTVPSVVDQCWGPCVPLLSCAPVASCDDCVMGWCAAYVGWTTEYRCLAPMIPCSALSCSCFGPFLCAAPYDVCTIGGPGEPVVSCECTSC